MGKGDKKTRRGKITISSYGNSRPHKVAAPVVVESDKKKKSTKKTSSTKKS
jgi:30S ribosomal protein S31